MDPERWRQVEQLYHSALEEEPGERGSFLGKACRGDAELQCEVEALLAATFFSVSGTSGSSFGEALAGPKNFMKYSLSFLEQDYRNLIRHLFASTTVEQASYLLCGISRSNDETRLVVRQVLPVPAEDITEQSPSHVRIRMSSFFRVMEQANASGQCFIFVHSHPSSSLYPTRADDHEERLLFFVAYKMISDPDLVHASVVLSHPDSPIGRVWLADGQVRPIDLIEIIGSNIIYTDPRQTGNQPPESPACGR